MDFVRLYFISGTGAHILTFARFFSLLYPIIVRGSGARIFFFFFFLIRLPMCVCLSSVSGVGTFPFSPMNVYLFVCE